jgi:hypothetical protein
MKKIIISLAFSLALTLAFAHGEDKKGPNGGFVRMPGAFHTEVVINSKNSLKVYLLDIDWKNPSVLKSEVKATLVAAKKTEDAKCSAKDNYFLCTFSKSVNLKKKSELQIMAYREEQKGNVANYNLPLSLEKAPDAEIKKTEDKMDHSAHH